MKPFIFCLTLLLSATSTFSQKKESVIIGEDFDGMSGYKWPLQNDSKMKASIENDHYNINVKVEGNSGYFAVPAKIRENGSYTIRGKIGWSSMPQGETVYGLVWGAASKDENFMFVINPLKKIFAVYKFSGGKATPIFAWTKCEKIKNDKSINELTVATMSGNWFFSINDTPIKKAPIQTFSGTSVGFYTMGKVDLKIDEIYVSSE